MPGAPSRMPLHVLETAPLGTPHVPSASPALQWDGWTQVPQKHHLREGNPVLRVCLCPQPALHNRVMLSEPAPRIRGICARTSRVRLMFQITKLLKALFLPGSCRSMAGTNNSKRRNPRNSHGPGNPSHKLCCEHTAHLEGLK